jgi:hypothetical protein
MFYQVKSYEGIPMMSISIGEKTPIKAFKIFSIVFWSFFHLEVIELQELFLKKVNFQFSSNQSTNSTF